MAGTYPLGFEGDVTPSYLRIDADGDWTIEIKPVEEARLWQADFISGTGADVLRFEGGASVLDYTNAGSSNFIVQYHRNPGFDLVVNEIARSRDDDDEAAWRRGRRRRGRLGIERPTELTI